MELNTTLKIIGTETPKHGPLTEYTMTGVFYNKSNSNRWLLIPENENAVANPQFEITTLYPFRSINGARIVELDNYYYAIRTAALAKINVSNLVWYGKKPPEQLECFWAADISLPNKVLSTAVLGSGETHEGDVDIRNGYGDEEIIELGNPTAVVFAGFEKVRVIVGKAFDTDTSKAK